MNTGEDGVPHIAEEVKHERRDTTLPGLEELRK